MKCLKTRALALVAMSLSAGLMYQIAATPWNLSSSGDGIACGPSASNFFGSAASARLSRELASSFEVTPLLTAATYDPFRYPIATCFAPGTPDDVVADFNAIMFPDDGIAYQLTNRWSGAQGSPRALTWSFAAENLSIPGGVGEPTAPNILFTRMDTLFGAANRATWITQFTNCFARWQQLTGLTYTRVISATGTPTNTDDDDGAAWGTGGAAGLRGDIRIAAHNIDGANGVLAYNQFPANGDMVIDSSESWGSSVGTYRFLRNTVMHEHGHGIGLLHVCPIGQNKLMEPFLNTNFDGPQQDDIRAGQRHYGDPSELNDSSAAATDLGTAIPGTPITRGPTPTPVVGNASILSIDADGENDYFKFTVGGSRTATVTVSPVGSTYPQAPQDSNCNTGTNVNALAQANLAVEIRDTNGTTVLGTASAAAIGLPETLSNVSLPVAGTYFIRVFETAAQTETQCYNLSLNTQDAVCVPPAITGQPATQTACTGDSVTFMVTATGTSLGYQWRRNAVNIGGATSSSYTIPSVVAGDAAAYSCFVSNACGNATSNNANLTVNEAINVTLQPASQSACTGGSVTFTTAATGTGPITFQWRFNSVAIPGATSSSYTDNDVQAGDAGTYNCVISSPCGQISTQNATLTIGGAGPSISQQPTNQSACQHGSATFTVVASNATGYQWRLNGVDIGGATSSSYTDSDVLPGDAGSYDCVISNSCGSVTSNPATLSVQLRGDANCDGAVNNFDIDAFVLAVSLGQASWEAQYPCDFLCACDVNGSGGVDNFDIDPFVICVTGGGCP